MCKIPCKSVQSLSLKNGLSLRKTTASGPGRIKNTYHHMTKSSTTPIVMLTLQDLRDVIREEMGSKREHVDTLTIKASQNFQS